MMGKRGEDKGGREKQNGSCAGKEAAQKEKGGEEWADVGGLPAAQGHEDDCQGPCLGSWSYHSQDLCSHPWPMLPPKATGCWGLSCHLWLFWYPWAVLLLKPS